MDLGSRGNTLSIVTHQTSSLSSMVAGVRGTKDLFRVTLQKNKKRELFGEGARDKRASQILKIH